jgi:hypothetical protein
VLPVAATGPRHQFYDAFLGKASATKRDESPDFNSNQLEGKYYYAQTAADVGPAFAALQNQILRLTK